MPQDTDFRSTIAKLQEKKFEALGVYLLPGQIETFYRQLSELGMKTPSFGTDFFESEQQVAAAGPAIDGALFPNNTVTDDFRKRYLDKFGNTAQIQWAGFGHDFLELAKDKLCSAAPKRSGEALIQSLRGTTVAGVTGNFGFVESDAGDKYFSVPVSLRVIRDGKIQGVAGQE